MTNLNFETARHNMVEYQIRCCKVLDSALLDTLETMPREQFLPEAVRSLAYMEGHAPLPCGQEMLTPLQEASMIQALAIQADERILEIGAGSGFLTTLLAMYGKEVMACEIHEELVELARRNLQSHGIQNASVAHVNAMDADALHDMGMFDIIVLGAAIQEVPAHIQALLKPEGRMLAFLGSNPVVSLSLIDNDADHPQQRTLFETMLLDIEGLPEKREFIF